MARPARGYASQLWRNGLAKTDLGDKQVCPSCGAKFYDLRRRPAMCPKCSTAFDPAEESVRTGRGRARVSATNAGYEDDEEETDAVAAKKKVDGEEDEEEEVEAVGVDAAAEADPIITDDDEEVEASGDVLPEGFSEEEADLEDETADDDTVPLIDDDEEFPEDEIGEIPADEDEDNNR